MWTSRFSSFLLIAALALSMSAAAQPGTVRDDVRLPADGSGLARSLDNQDRFGSGLTSVGDLDGNGVADIVIGASGDDDGPGSDVGAIYVFFLEADGTFGDFQKVSRLRGGLDAGPEEGDYFGTALATIGDLDGDGISEIAVSAVGDDDGGTRFDGAVYVLFLNADGTVRAQQKISATEGGFSGNTTPAANFGISVEGIGDFDGDGIPDLAVGASYDGAQSTGALFLLFLNADGTVKGEVKIGEGTGGFSVDLDPRDAFGQSLALVGDLDGDLVPELVVGAPGDDDGGPPTTFGRGAAYVLFLNADGSVRAEQKISATEGGLQADLVSPDQFGGSATSIGDLNADGVPDVAVGAQEDDGDGDGKGAFYVLFLNSDGTVKAEQEVSSTAGGLSPSLMDQDAFGNSLTSPGDLDGDGVRDLVVGASDTDGEGFARGAIYVLFLNGSDSPPPSDDIDIEVTSFTDPISRGGVLDVFGALTNSTGTDREVRVVLRVTPPSRPEQTFEARTVSVPAMSTLGPARAIRVSVPNGAPTGQYSAALVAQDVDSGEDLASDSFQFTLAPESDITSEMVSGEVGLLGAEAGPNPFTERTVIRYRLDIEAHVDLRVYDAAGRELAILVDGFRSMGEHRATFDGRGLPAGVYVWRLTAGERVTTGRLLLVR